MSDFYFLTYDADEMWQAMNEAYRKAGGGVLMPGDPKETLLRGVQGILMQVYAATDVTLKMNTLRYAAGEYLKLYGEERGVAYMDALKPTASVQLALAAGTVSADIPAGTRLRDGDGLTWLTLEGIEHPAGPAAVYVVPVECETAGAVGNIRAAGDPLISVKGTAKVSSAVFYTDAAGGRDAETEEAYRERIRLSLFASTVTGSRQMYIAKTKAVSTDIIDANAVNGGAGNVNVYLLLKDGADAEEIVSAVSDALNADDARPLTDTVTVTEGTAVNYRIVIDYSVPETGDVLSKMQQAAEEYRAWQESALGRAFNPYKLISALYNAGAERATIDTDESFCGDGACDYTEIDADEMLTGTVELNEVTA